MIPDRVGSPQAGIAMVLTKSDYIPTHEELKVEEVPLGAPYLKAGAFHLGKHCESTNNEYMLCRQENNDPRFFYLPLLFTLLLSF